jgi:GTP 3',8-cyclase
MRLTVLETSSASAPSPAFETGPKSISAVRVLRISVTDRCNFRCVYCMPEEGMKWLPKDDILTFEEIVAVARAAMEVHGIRRFKITGGEPTVRHGIVELVHRMRRLKGIEDLSLTTNGMLLEELAQPLREAGLDRVTVSMDSLREDRFRRITRTGELAKVLRGLDRVEDVGFSGTKINCVTMRGTNDDEFGDFARLTVGRTVTVRFIEYMPLGDAAVMHVGEEKETRRGQGLGEAVSLSPPRLVSLSSSSLRVDDQEIGPAGGCGAQDRGAEAFISETEVRARIAAEVGELVPVDRSSEPGVGPAVVWRLRQTSDGRQPRGRIGFISAMSAPFCATCNRLRLTANGVLRSCLFEGGEVDIRSILRVGGLDELNRRGRVAQAMVDCVRLKPDVHSHRGNEQMSRIGG